MKYDFDKQINRRGTYSLKWDGGELIKQIGLTERYDEDSIPLFTADMDLPVPQPVIDALHRTVDHQIFGYTIIPPEYYEAIQKWFAEKYDWQIAVEEIVYAPGTVHALNMAIKAFSEKGDGVIIQRPVYPPFTNAVERHERVVQNNALVQNDDGDYVIDFADFEAKAKDPNTTMFILCNPHNPTGRIFSNEDLRRMSDICAENGVTIVADEIHGDLIRTGQTFTPIVKTVENDDHIVTLTAINKTFNLAGLHCTNVIISNQKMRDLFTAEIGMSLPSPFTVSALIAAYNEGQEWLDQLKVYLDENLAFVKQFLDERMPKVKTYIPEGTYVMWMDFSGYGISADEVHDRIYNEANVILEDGKMFGEEGLDFQRICVPSPRPLIKEAMERIENAFADLN